MKVIYLNGKLIKSKADLHSELAAQLSFPDYYGGNLDALYDMLSMERERCLILIKNMGELEENLGGYCSGFLRVLDDVYSENKKIVSMTIN
jgi:ribonuclease inhibitor